VDLEPLWQVVVLRHKELHQQIMDVILQRVLAQVVVVVVEHLE
jgi:hypothetical protein